MAKIIIGREYRDEFNSIVNLVRGGFVSDAIHINKVSSDLIETAGHTFVYDDSARGVNGSEGDDRASFRLGKGGASWFKALRGEKFDSGSSDWKQLIMDVAEDYHRHYSLIEFKQKSSDRSLAAEKEVIRRFESGFLHRVFGREFSFSDERGVDPENFYAVSVRLDINGGAESAPLLGKVYFRESDDGHLTPLTRAEAEAIDSYINKAVPYGDGAKDEGGIVDTALVSRVFDGLESAFAIEDFADYVFFADKYKKELCDMLSKNATSEIKELECTNVKVLGLSHVEWQKASYSVLHRGKRVLKFQIGLNDSVTLTCVNCGDNAILVDGSTVRYVEGLEPVFVPTLDFNRDDLGLTEGDIDDILGCGVLRDHLFKVTCSENPRNPECSKVVCASQSISVEIGGGKRVKKCKNCRYPEIVYGNVFAGGDEGKYTPTLNFDAGRMALVEERTKKCRCCGREFAESSLTKGGLCKFCSSAARTDDDKAAYKKYASFLGLGIRMKHLFAKKYCRRDGNIMLFELGEDKYVFDKLDANEYGYIKKPVKYKRHGGAR